MQANWSLTLNILLLTGVLVAIIRMLKSKKQSMPVTKEPAISSQVLPEKNDDVISVRKVSRENVQPVLNVANKMQDKPWTPAQPSMGLHKNPIPSVKPEAPFKPYANQVSASKVIEEPRVEPQIQPPQDSLPTLMIFLLAKEKRQLAGYELLQTILAAGLRFGEGHLFHRHQFANGQGPVLCSLATATASGVFDLQNIGAFSVHGLCLFMEASGNASIDQERFSIMLDTAKQLSEGLDTHLLDDERKPWTQDSKARYLSRLSFTEEACELAE